MLGKEDLELADRKLYRKECQVVAILLDQYVEMECCIDRPCRKELGFVILVGKKASCMGMFRQVVYISIHFCSMDCNRACRFLHQIHGLLLLC